MLNVLMLDVKCFKYFYTFQFVLVILHYVLDFKYGDQSSFTGVFEANYAN